MKLPAAKPAAEFAKYNAFIVGTGNSGLITEAIIAKNESKTLVLEQADQIGGRLELLIIVHTGLTVAP